MMTAIPDDKPTSGKRQRRRIRFHERVQFKTIRHVSEFSDEEIKNGWYDKDDFNRMSENVSDIARLIADGETCLIGEELCTRGLEHIVEEELADYRAEKMINSIDAVLDEQEEQWDEGKEDPGLIAELYAEYAKPLLREAHLIGLKDSEQGYTSWDDLLDEKQYEKLTIKRITSPIVTDNIGTGKIDKGGKAKKIKKVKKSDDPLQQRKFPDQRVKQSVAQTNTLNVARKSEKIGIVKTKGKKNKVKKSSDLVVREQLDRNKITKQQVCVNPSQPNTVSKVKNEDFPLSREIKKKNKRSGPQENEEKGKEKNSTLRISNTPSSYTDESLSSSSLLSSTSSQLSPLTSSSHILKNQGSISSINSFTLRDLSMRSISEEFDTIRETEKNNFRNGKGGSLPLAKSDTMLLKAKPKPLLQRNGGGSTLQNNKSNSQKKQRKTQPRRSAIDRKHGTELSPFVFRRDGTLTFRKPDVEKLKREQKEKRKNCIRGSLTKFLHDDEEDDILAGILSSTR